MKKKLVLYDKDSSYVEDTYQTSKLNIFDRHLQKEALHANLLRCAQKPGWPKVLSESFPDG
jgi:hypothetical protein